MCFAALWAWFSVSLVLADGESDDDVFIFDGDDYVLTGKSVLFFRFSTWEPEENVLDRTLLQDFSSRRRNR